MLTTPTDLALWETLLWATTDADGEPLDRHYNIGRFGSVDIDPDALRQLSRQFYWWSDQAAEIMIRHGFGDLCLEDLLGSDRVEHTYVLVRDGHGVGMADGWTACSRQWFCCRELEKLARAQGEIGAYVGDGGQIYCSWSI